MVARPPPPPPLHPPTLGMGSVGQNSALLEHSHVAYQITGNHECSNMVANILPADPSPTTLGMGSIGQNSTFSEHGHVAYQIKWNHKLQQHGSTYFAHLPTDRPPPPPPLMSLTWSVGHKSTLCCISN